MIVLIYVRVLGVSELILMVAELLLRAGELKALYLESLETALAALRSVGHESVNVSAACHVRESPSLMSRQPVCRLRPDSDETPKTCSVQHRVKAKQASTLTDSWCTKLLGVSLPGSFCWNFAIE